MILNLNETVATMPDWISLHGKTLDGGYELGDVLETDDSTAHFRVRVLGDSSIAAYASFYVAEGAVASEQLLVWQELRGLKHPNLKTPISSGRMKLQGVSTIYVICTMPDETLSEILGDRGLSDEEGAELLKGLGQGLLCLHSNGFAHGAVSPEMTVAVGEAIQLSTECARRLNTAPKVEVAKARYLAPEVSVANVSMSADVWCLGATIFESLVQKKYERTWFGDLERLGPGKLLQRCLDTNPHTRARLSELIDPPAAGRGEATAVPAGARVKPVKVSRKPIGTNRIRTLDPSEMQLVKFDSSYGIERLRARVKSTGSSWRPVMAAGAALILLIVVVWLVILPKFQSISDPSADETQQPKTAWPTKTIGSPEAQPVDAPAAATSATWRFVLGSYEHEADADRRIELLNKTHPDLDVKKLAQSPAGPFYVVSGGPMSQADANELRKKALKMGISRSSYVGNFSN
jgi:hypothetical protein